MSTNITKPRRPLLLCLCGTLLAVAAVVLLFFFPKNNYMPVMKWSGKTYTCGMPLKMTDELYESAYNVDAEILTRTVDGEEFIYAYGVRKPWPDSEPNRTVSVGGLYLGDTEEMLLKKYPKAATDGLKTAGGRYNADETWEDFTVYYYENEAYSPTEYEALLASVSESEQDTIRIRSYALVVLTIQDEIDCVHFGDYSLIQIMRQAMDGTSPYA